MNNIIATFTENEQKSKFEGNELNSNVLYIFDKSFLANFLIKKVSLFGELIK